MHWMTRMATTTPNRTRWIQLALGVSCMMLIANLQYGWTLFVKPMHVAHGWSVSDIQWGFSIFIALETWLTPAGGWLVDSIGNRRGPGVAVALGGVAVALGWVLNAFADSLPVLYAGAVMSGIGAGFIYATCVGAAVKWFPDRRGLAVGITAAGFGAGAALTVIPVKTMIEASGYAHTFLVFGLGQGVLLLLMAGFLRGPAPGEAPAPAVRKPLQSAVSLTPGAMLRSPIFWALYAMFVLVSASGLMATAQLALIASDLGVDKTLLFGGASVLSVALVVDNLANGGARPFFGWVSDRLGRETTMVIAFGLGGGAYLLMAQVGASPWLFVVCAAVIFFTWGEIFSLFPSTCADAFGSRYATVNASLLYTAKGTSALLVPFANVIKTASGGWSAVFMVAAAMNFIVVLMALLVLKPLREGHVRRATAAAATGAVTA